MLKNMKNRCAYAIAGMVKFINGNNCVSFRMVGIFKELWQGAAVE